MSVWLAGAFMRASAWIIRGEESWCGSTGPVCEELIPSCVLICAGIWNNERQESCDSTEAVYDWQAPASATATRRLLGNTRSCDSDAATTMTWFEKPVKEKVTAVVSRWSVLVMNEDESRSSLLLCEDIFTLVYAWYCQNHNLASISPRGEGKRRCPRVRFHVLYGCHKPYEDSWT